MDAITAADHRSRRRHCLQLQLPLPVSLIPFCSSHSQWICNDRPGLWIRDGGRHVLKTTERSGSASNAGGGTGYNATCWVWLWSSSGRWCAMRTCTGRGGWSIYWPSLCSARGQSHTLSDICNARIVLRRWQGGVRTLNYRGYRTPSFRGIPLASWYGNASISRGKLTIPQRPTLVLILTISKTSNISYYRSSVTEWAIGMHSPIYMFNVKNVGNISSGCIRNGGHGRLLLERPGRYSTWWVGAV